MSYIQNSQCYTVLLLSIVHRTLLRLIHFQTEIITSFEDDYAVGEFFSDYNGFRLNKYGCV
jgi:hypothetical protein